eukprot:574935-Amphidinium_carterae.2
MSVTPVAKKRAVCCALDGAWEADANVAKRVRKRCDPSIKRRVQKAIADNLKSLCSFQIDCLVVDGDEGQRVMSENPNRGDEKSFVKNFSDPSRLTCREYIERDKEAAARGVKVKALYSQETDLCKQLKISAEDQFDAKLYEAYKALQRHPPNRGLLVAWCSGHTSLTCSETRILLQSLLRLNPSSSTEQLHVCLEIMQCLTRAGAPETYKDEVTLLKLPGAAEEGHNTYYQTWGGREAGHRCGSACRGIVLEEVTTMIATAVSGFMASESCDESTLATCLSEYGSKLECLESVHLIKGKRTVELDYRGLKFSTVIRSPEEELELALRAAIR